MSARVKEVGEIIHTLLSQGWRVERGKHWVAYPPDPSKRMVYFSQTPSDWRALMNIKSSLRKSGALI